MEELSKDSISDLFSCVMQHIKCIEIRIDYARAATSKKQKYALKTALTKVIAASNQICDLLGDSEMVLKVKKELDKVDMLYIMLLTEQLSRCKSEDLEEITEMIDDYLNKKYVSKA